MAAFSAGNPAASTSGRPSARAIAPASGIFRYQAEPGDDLVEGFTGLAFHQPCARQRFLGHGRLAPQDRDQPLGSIRRERAPCRQGRKIFACRYACLLHPRHLQGPAPDARLPRS